MFGRGFNYSGDLNTKLVCYMDHGPLPSTQMHLFEENEYQTNSDSQDHFV